MRSYICVFGMLAGIATATLFLQSCTSTNGRSQTTSTTSRNIAKQVPKPVATTAHTSISPSLVRNSRASHTQNENTVLSVKGTKDWTVYSLAFSPEGETLVSGGVQEEKAESLPSILNADLNVAQNQRTTSAEWTVGKVRLWDVRTRQLLSLFSGTSDDRSYFSAVHTVAFSPDAKNLATGSSVDNVRLWDAQTGRLKLTMKYCADTVVFSPDGRILALLTGKTASAVDEVSARDSGIKLCDVQTGRIYRTLSGDNHSITGIDFSPQENVLVSVSDKELKLWNVQTGRAIWVQKEQREGRTVKFSLDGETIASGDGLGTVKLWDARNGQLKRHLQQRLQEGTAAVLSLAFSPDSRMLAVGSWNGMVRVWNIETGQLKHTVIVGNSVYAHVYALAFSSDNTLLAIGGNHSVLRLEQIK